MVVAQAQTVECDGRRLVFTFGPEHEHLRNQIELRRPELEKLAEQLAGQRVPIATLRGVAPSPNEPAPRVTVPPPPPLAPTPTCARGRWPTPACRRCSRSFRRRSGTWRRCSRTSNR